MEIFSVQKTYGLSTQNEPSDDLILSANVRQYPDMYYAYKKMRDKVALSHQDILLGNGFENVMKNVLLGLKIKSMYWDKPAWGMLDTYCDQLDIVKINGNFKYDKGSKIIKNTKNIPPCDAYYTTLFANSYFTHVNVEDFNRLNNCKYIILDLSYLSFNEVLNVRYEFKNNDKVIIISSFDKLIGCGLRLGYAIFNKKYSSKILLQKERCINMLAYNFILNTDFNYKESSGYTRCLNNKDLVNKTYCITPNFMMVKGKIETTLPHQLISIDGFKFTKFGIPNNDNEYNALLTVLGVKNDNYS